MPGDSLAERRPREERLSQSAEAFDPRAMAVERTSADSPSDDSTSDDPASVSADGADGAVAAGTLAPPPAWRAGDPLDLRRSRSETVLTLGEVPGRRSVLRIRCAPQRVSAC